MSTAAAGTAAAPLSVAQPIAKAIDLFKVYREGDTETVALRGASLTLDRGEFVTLVGPSGSGKSTLLSIMAGLTLPTAGRVMIDGRDLSRLDEVERAAVRAESIGLVFQRGNLIPFLTTQENVELALEAAPGRPRSSGRARELLEMLGLDNRRGHRPRQLSGGEAQRAGIAVALANAPQLILGDEITGELDSETSAQVMDVLLRLRSENGMTLLVVTHNPALAAAADRRLVISRRADHQRMKLPAVNARNLRRSYHTPAGVINAVDGIDIEVPEGQRLAIMGPSGCGKSTLLSLIGCLEPAELGHDHGAGHRPGCAQPGASRRVAPRERGLHLPGLRPGAVPHRHRERGADERHR